jgi:hypothetical protein
MGWSLPYTLGVLGRWKMAAVYCQAVLCYDQRIALDGSPAETVDAEAKDLATKQLAQLAARKAKKAAEAAAPAVVALAWTPTLWRRVLSDVFKQGAVSMPRDHLVELNKFCQSLGCPDDGSRKCGAWPYLFPARCGRVA